METNEAAMTSHSRTLDDIASDIVQRLWAIDQAGGELDEDIEGELDALDVELTTKIDRIASVCDAMKARVNLYSERAKAFLQAAKRIDADKKRLEAYAIRSMQAVDRTRIEGENHPAISVRKNPARLNITDETAIPEKYWVTPEPPPPRPVNADIKAALKAGDVVPGAELTHGHKLVY